MAPSRLMLPLGACLSAVLVIPVAAQDASHANARAPENVRLDYAQVLNVEPVYQTLRASRTEMRCEEVSKPSPPPAAEEGRWGRLVDTVKDVFTREPDPVASATRKADCRMVPVQREFRRPIAYDVDYVYKGVKYRSRLPEDPGNRLRIRVSVMPYLPDQAVTLP